MYEFQDKQYSRILRLSFMILLVACFALWQQIGRIDSFLNLFATNNLGAAAWIFIPVACLILMVSAVLVVLAKSVNEMQHIRRLAFIDELTELPNRRSFNGTLEKEIVSSFKSGEQIAVMYFDLDRFKVINDCHGHDAGDQIIKACAERLTAAVRPDDFVARLAGDEFAAIIKNTESDRIIIEISERIFESMKEPVLINNNKKLYAGASIGAVVITDPTIDAVEALNRADFALLNAKDSGRNRLSLFDPTMARSIKDRHQMEIDLREAIQNNELKIRYQPLIDIKSETITGVEALVRWHHPRRGMISPADFIPMAEEIGVIDQLGEFVLHKACMEMKDRENLKLAVNISPKQFVQDDFTDKVKAALDETGFEPSRLELEITEGVLISNPYETVKILTGLRKLGVEIALDDFGTGFSSMSYLRRYPLDRIKIDKSFIDGMETEDDAFNFLSKMIELGGSLGMSVTVEGVETQSQLELLKLSQVNEIQGFLFSKPMTAEELMHCDLVQEARAALLSQEIMENQSKKKTSKKSGNPSLRLVS